MEELWPLRGQGWRNGRSPGCKPRGSSRLGTRAPGQETRGGRWMGVHVSIVKPDAKHKPHDATLRAALEGLLPGTLNLNLIQSLELPSGDRKQGHSFRCEVT